MDLLKNSGIRLWCSSVLEIVDDSGCQGTNQQDDDQGRRGQKWGHDEVDCIGDQWFNVLVQKEDSKTTHGHQWPHDVLNGVKRRMVNKQAGMQVVRQCFHLLVRVLALTADITTSTRGRGRTG